ncbi:MAG: proline--tRNA ligase [Sphingobacteriia bacterium]|nr:proline--tRNA ligase [Sphingobacteriia bacterium]
MHMSQLFLPVLKEDPREAQVISHRLMLKAGMIRQVTSGIYNWLPLGLKVLKKVENIIREEMDSSGAQEILMPTIQPASLWIESGRFEAYGKEMLKIKDRHENDMLYGPTHEEVVTDIVRHTVKSYKQLPLNLYQIQWKFRDEIRPRFGVMRGREFLMKDAYSFDLTKEEAEKSYALMFKTYVNIFKRMGLNALPMQADTGQIGGNLSHEFHVIAETGESEVFYDKRIHEEKELDINNYKKYYAATDEKHDVDKCNVPAEYLVNKKGIEVGHIFYLGTKYSEVLKLQVMGSNGAQITPEMGCYGIGVSRLVAAIIEASHDEKGIIWPEQVAPFDYAIIPLGNSEAVMNLAQKIYEKYLSEGYNCLLDDSEGSVGNKLATNDLIGTPKQIIIGPKNLEKGVVEIKDRKTNISKEVNISEF